METVLVCWGCHDKVHSGGGLNSRARTVLGAEVREPGAASRAGFL